MIFGFRASTGALKDIFEKYASLEVDGVKYMTDEDFVIKWVFINISRGAAPETILVSINGDPDPHSSNPHLLDPAV